MDISSRFSLTDFLAYLFPGVFTTGGLYFLLLLTPLERLCEKFQLDLNGGILFLIFSFIVGVIASGIAEVSTHSIRHQHDNELPLKNFEKNIKAAFKSTFGGKEDFTWTREHFYLCRSTVFQYMPNGTFVIQRQSGLRQMRMNMLPSFFVWTITGVLWGCRISIFRQGWGLTLIVASMILGVLLLVLTLKTMEENNTREIRETLTAFLSGYKTGLFKEKKI